MTEVGSVFTGIAEVFPSGFGLHKFDRTEESIQIDDTYMTVCDPEPLLLDKVRALAAAEGLFSWSPDQDLDLAVKKHG